MNVLIPLVPIFVIVCGLAYFRTRLFRESLVKKGGPEYAQKQMRAIQRNLIAALIAFFFWLLVEVFRP